MLSPRQTIRSSAPAKLSAIPTTCAIPPGSTCTLYVRSSSNRARRGAPVADPPVSEQIDQLAGMALPGDDHHLVHARQLQQLQRVVDHRPAADRQQMLVDDARQLAQPRGLAAGRDQSLCLHAGADATAGAAIGVRASSQKRHLERWADQEREGDRSDPDLAAEKGAGDDHARLEQRPDDADPPAGAKCEHEHERVARTRAEPSPEVEGGTDRDQSRSRRRARRSAPPALPPRGRQRLVRAPGPR